MKYKGHVYQQNWPQTFIEYSMKWTELSIAKQSNTTQNLSDFAKVFKVKYYTNSKKNETIAFGANWSSSSIDRSGFYCY